MTGTMDWQGAVGDVWARDWRITDRSFAGLAPHLDTAILTAAPAGDFTAVDIGCGAGETSIALATARPDARVLGVDLSAALASAATARAARLDNLRFAAADAAAGASQAAPVDLFCSRHGVMFFDDPVVTFTSLHASAAPGAPFVFSCFNAVPYNPWATALFASSPPGGYVPGPFAFADPDWVAAMLAAAGWRDAAPKRVDFRYVAGQGDDPVADARAFFERIGPTAGALRGADPAARETLLARLTEILADARDGDTVAFPASAWLWTVIA